MKRILLGVLATAILAPAGELKQLPGQAGNDDIDLTASVLVTRDEIQEALGADIGAGYVVVRVKATPKTEQPLRIGPDDFTVISRKDGQRSPLALAPNRIAGSGGGDGGQVHASSASRNGRSCWAGSGAGGGRAALEEGTPAWISKWKAETPRQRRVPS